MRYMALGAVLFLASLGIDKFVTPDQLPTVDKSRPVVVPEADPQPTPIQAGCQCGCKRAQCSCSKSLTACTSPVQLDATAVERFANEVNRLPVVWGFAPEWCPNCPEWVTKFGQGNETFRIEWKHKEAHYEQDSGEYPCFYYPAESKQLVKTPQTLEDIQRGFGIKPKMSSAIIQVGTLKNSDIAESLKYLELADAVTITNKPFVYMLYGYPIEVPANFTATKTVAGDTTRLAFSPPLKTKLTAIGVNLHQACDAVEITPTRIELSLPGAPDVYFKRID